MRVLILFMCFLPLTAFAQSSGGISVGVRPQPEAGTAPAPAEGGGIVATVPGSPAPGGSAPTPSDPAGIVAPAPGGSAPAPGGIASPAPGGSAPVNPAPGGIVAPAPGGASPVSPAPGGIAAPAPGGASPVSPAPGGIAAPAPGGASPAPSGRVDLTDPATWIGKTITGRLRETGRNWYSQLRADGRTTFVTTRGNRNDGRYRIRGRSVCYLYDGETTEACRTPVADGNVIRWRDDSGRSISDIVAVDNTPLPASAATPPQAGNRAAVTRAIGPGRCALIVASRQTVAEAKAFVAQNIQDRRFTQGFVARNGWIAISLIVLPTEDAQAAIPQLKANGAIPPDSFCSSGRGFLDVIDVLP